MLLWYASLIFLLSELQQPIVIHHTGLSAAAVNASAWKKFATINETVEIGPMSHCENAVSIAAFKEAHCLCRPGSSWQGFSAKASLCYNLWFLNSQILTSVFTTTVVALISVMTWRLVMSVCVPLASNWWTRGAAKVRIWNWFPYWNRYWKSGHGMFDLW